MAFTNNTTKYQYDGWNDDYDILHNTYFNKKSNKNRFSSWKWIYFYNKTGKGYNILIYYIHIIYKYILGYLGGGSIYL